MAKDVGSLRTRLSFEKTGDSNLTDLQRDLKGIRSEMNNFRASSRAYRTSLKGMREESDILTRRLQVQRERVAELKRRYDEAKKTTGENSAETKDLAAQYNNAQAQMKRTEQQLDRLNQIIRTQESRWTKLGNHLDKAGKKMQEVGRGLTSFGRAYSVRVTTPILGAGAAALKVGMDFEEGMSKVQAISGATGDDLIRLKNQAKDLGATTRFSATEAASGMEFLAMAGFNSNQILGAMPGLLDLAASSNMDLGRAADITSNIISGFNMEALESTRVADVLAKGASTANTNVEQLGGAAKYAAPIFNTLKLEIEGLVASVGFMSDAGIQGEQAGRQLRQGLLRLANPTGEASKLIKKLGINVFDAYGNMKEMHEVVAELEKGFKGMTPQARASALAIIFGAESTAGWSTLLDRGSKELKNYTKELQNSEGAAAEMAEVMQDNAKGAIVEFKSALEGAGIAASEHIIPAVTDITKKATELIRKFGELDEEQQKQILKWLALTAAVGPTAIVLGHTTTALGGIFRAGGNVAKMLGRARGAGLIGRLSLLSGPSGVAILAAGALAFLGKKAYDSYKDSKKLHDVTIELADKLYEQYDANNVLIDSFDKLREKSKLTNEQFADYLDLQTKISKETDPEKIKVMQQEMEMLQKYSGLSNEELEEMIEYNNKIIEVLPESATHITDQGNRIADTTENLKEYNEEVRRTASRELEKQFQTSLANYQKRMEMLKNEQEELNTLVEYEEFLRDKILDINNKGFEKLQEELEAESERIEKALLFGGIKEEEIDKYNKELELINKVLDNMQLGEEHLREHLSLHMDVVDQQRLKVDKTKEELDEINVIVERMAEQYLIAAEISDEKAKQIISEGRTTEYLNEQLDNLRKQKRELDKKYPVEQRSSQEYRDQAEEINKQINRLKTAKSNIEALTNTARSYNSELGKRVEKQVGIYTNPSIESLNSLLARPINKQIRMQGHDFYAAYAKGTNHHPGGPFIAGEEGWELGRYRDRWEVLNFGLYNRPPGYQVFTHDESKRILRQLNNIPAYAGGTGGSPSAFTDKSTVINNDNHIVINATIRDEHDIDKLTKKLDATLSNLSDRRRAAFGG